MYGKDAVYARGASMSDDRLNGQVLGETPTDDTYAKKSNWMLKHEPTKASANDTEPTRSLLLHWIDEKGSVVRLITNSPDPNASFHDQRWSS